MVGINASNIKYKNLTFGAQDIAAETPMAMTPAEISNNPYADKHGSKFKDSRGLLSAITPESRNLMPELPDYDSYMSSKNQVEQPVEKKNRSSLLKTFLVLGGLTAGGVLIYKNKNKLFKSSNILGGVPKSGLKATPKNIGPEKFTAYFDDAMNKAYNLNAIDKIKIDNIQVIMRDVTNVAEKKQHLKNLYELGKIYNDKHSQARIVFIIPEHIQDEANTIIDAFKVGDIDAIDNRLIQEIEGFQLLNIDRAGADAHMMIVDCQTRQGINANNAGDVSSKWWTIFKEFLKKII